MDRHHRILAALALAAALPLAGCNLERPPEPQPINSYLAEPADLANVRRVMVLPFTNQAGVNADCAKMRDAFVAELQKLRRFEVVPLPSDAEEDDVLNASLRRGRLSTDAMVRLATRYSLDGVLIGTITSWRPYLPAHLGMRTQLISVHSGATVWAVDAMYDTSDRATISDLRHFVQTTQADNKSLHGWELHMIAPQLFTNYVAHRFVCTWAQG